MRLLSTVKLTCERSLTVSASRSVCVVCSPRTTQPAACAEVMPAGASSTARHCCGSRPSAAAPARNGSGCGLPCAMSSEVTIVGGKGSPAAASRALASLGGQLVTTAQLPAGSAANASTAPGSAMTSEVSAVSPSISTLLRMATS